MRCVAVLSGGLDSQLAIRIMQTQGIEVEALNFKTVFTCCQNQSAEAARKLGVRLTVLNQEEDYLDVIRYPRFGYGRGANPCVDCRIYMFQRARSFMEQVDAAFIVSGEVVGQRPMSQKRRDLEVISYHSELEDLLLRPLSAKLLPPTKPEREGWVDREKLFRFNGRSRRPLIKLAKSLGIEDIPSPSTGCALTEKTFSEKVFDLIRLDPTAGTWQFKLLTHGRHFRYDENCKVIVGRHEAENVVLEGLHELPDAESSALLMPEGLIGPAALVVGPLTDGALQFAVGLIWRYSKKNRGDGHRIRALSHGEVQFLQPESHPVAENAQTVATLPVAHPA